MPETIVRKVDGNGNVREIVNNGGSYTVRLTDASGNVVAERSARDPDEATGMLQQLELTPVSGVEHPTRKEQAAILNAQGEGKPRVSRWRKTTKKET